MINTNPTQQFSLSPRIDTTDKPEQQTQSPAIALATVPQSTAVVATPARQTLRQIRADEQNVGVLLQRLREMAKTPVTSSPIISFLNTETLAPVVGSSYALTRSTPPTLASVITDLGFQVPTNVHEVRALEQQLVKRVAWNPLGNLGGGLSWPIPMPPKDMLEIKRALISRDLGIKDLEIEGVARYLYKGSSLSVSDLENPSLALEKILDSPRAQVLGKALQERLNGASSDTSVYDYLLMALQLRLDPEVITAQGRNKTAGFDLVHPGQWGYPPELIVQNLRSYLVDKKRATSQTSILAAHLLLSRVAPQFLIQNIPPHIKVGSMAWTNLSIAAAAIEAKQPGTVANMTFSQVMALSEAAVDTSQATQQAKTNALIDWGVANGIIEVNDADTYTVAQLNSAKTAFNQQLNERLTASKTLDKELPTRKEIALAKLKERFGDLGELFEEKVLGTHPNLGEPGQTGFVGLHSLLDIAMMDEPNSRPFTSTDPRIPVDTLNNNRRFGMDFDEQFARAIDDKKAAVNTTVQHMISQLPFVDRKNFEFGKLTFFQQKKYESDGQWGGTPKVNTPELLVTTEVNGQSVAYEINFNKGTIERTNPDRARTRESRVSRWISSTEVFSPHNANSALGIERPVNAGLLDSFNSDRSRAIGAVFVEHLELDDPSIKAQARGQTTLDELQGGPKPLSEFLLNLIPFRSAVVNFQKGNYGEGAFDLTLDIFGFLTAGAAAGGKLLKIGSSALSTGSKALKSAKVLGAATIGALNPLSGVGDIATGGVKLLSTGGRYLMTKGAEVVNALKGADGSYDLLKAASKTNGVTATGTFKLADSTVEGGAILQDAKWYALDPGTQRPYGAAIADFKPATVAANGEINNNFLNWLTAVVAPNARTPNLPSVFRNTLDTAKKNTPGSYNLGYASGDVANIPGYYPMMKISDLKELTVLAGRTPEEIGALAKLIQNRQASNSLESARVFNQEITAAGGKPIAMPQNLYLAQNDLASAGECAALANTMALAIQHGKKDVLIGNFFKASTQAADPAYATFRQQLNSMHQVLSVNFHGTQQVFKVPYTDIISRLKSATTTTTLKISTQNHGLLAGVTIKNNQKEWFFFDPNFGLATFADQASMERGLKTTLNSGKTAGTLDPVAITNGVPEYNISTFSDGDFLMSVPYNNPFGLFNTEL